MNNDAMNIWSGWCSPPDYAKKTIKGGRLSGMTDISPMWRIKVLTERFGLCGKGWRIKEKERWVNEYEGEVIANVKIELIFILDGEEHTVEGVGGAKLVSTDKNGKYLNDEAWKMATTDAISVACKMIGIGADIYMNAPASKYMLTQTPKDTNQEDPALTAFRTHITAISRWQDKLASLGYECIEEVPANKRREIYTIMKKEETV